MSNYWLGIAVSGLIAAGFLIAGFWPQRRRRNRSIGVRLPVPDSRSSIERHRRELGTR